MAFAVAWPIRLFLEGVDELLEVAVGDVVARPVGDGIELDAVGELHGAVAVEEFVELVETFLRPSGLLRRMEWTGECVGCVAGTKVFELVVGRRSVKFSGLGRRRSPCRCRS